MKFASLCHSLLLAEAAASRAEYLRQRWPKLTDEQLRQILEADPTDEKRYAQWIARLLAADDIRLPEDAAKVKDTLSTLEWLKRSGRLKGAESDVMRYARYGDLAEKIEGLGEKHGEQQAPKVADDMHGLVTIYYEPPWQIVRATDADACMKLASGSKWCVTQKPYAKRYLGQGPLFFIFKHGKKFALLHQKDLRDPMDRRLGPEQERELAPVLWDARLLGLHSATVSDDLIIWVQPRPKVVERDPQLALDYVYKVLHGKPFPEGEETLASKSGHALSYAHAVKKPFPAGERAIATNGQDAVSYALDVLDAPFPSGERAMLWPGQHAADARAVGRYVDLVRKTEGEEGVGRLRAMVEELRKKAKGREALVRLHELQPLVGAAKQQSDGESKLSPHIVSQWEYPFSTAWNAAFPEGQPQRRPEHMIFVKNHGRPWLYLDGERGKTIDATTGSELPAATVIPLLDMLFEEQRATANEWLNALSKDEVKSIVGKMTADDIVVLGESNLPYYWALYGKGEATAAYYRLLDKIDPAMVNAAIGTLVDQQRAGRIIPALADYLHTDLGLQAKVGGSWYWQTHDGNKRLPRPATLKKYFEQRGGKRLPELEKRFASWHVMNREAGIAMYRELLDDKQRAAFDASIEKPKEAEHAAG